MLRPTDFGAVGDGRHDDSKALNDMFSASMSYDRPAFDLTGDWYVGQKVVMQVPTGSQIVAGAISALQDADLDAILHINLGARSSIRGIMTISGKKTSHLKGRNVTTGVELQMANRCIFDGFDVSHVRRDAIKNAPYPGSNIIGAALGHITARFCGAHGIRGVPEHTRASTVSKMIKRIGSANSPSQRAIIDLEEHLPVWIGDFLVINGKPMDGGHICEVTSAGGTQLEVYPWPGALEGEGKWSVEALIGAGLHLIGGNTTQVTISSLLAQYCGHALRASSLYGCHATAVTGEVVGSAVTLAGRAAALRGFSLRGLHGEITVTDVLVAGLSVQRALIMAGAEDVVPNRNGYQIVPRTITGDRTGYIWPVTTIP